MNPAKQRRPMRSDAKLTASSTSSQKTNSKFWRPIWRSTPATPTRTKRSTQRWPSRRNFAGVHLLALGSGQRHEADPARPTLRSRTRCVKSW